MDPSRPRPLRVPLPGSYCLDPSPTWAWLQEHAPVTRATTAAGQEVWLVTRYAQVRTVLCDPRFSRAAAVRPGGPHAGAVASRPGTLTALDPPAHTRMRRLVAGPFAPRHIEQWRPWIATLATELVGAMAAGPQPADLCTGLALPLPLAVVSRLLGVPAADRDRFRGWADQLATPQAPDPAAAATAHDELFGYLADLLDAKQTAPPGEDPDLLGDLVAHADGPQGLSGAELAGFAASLLVGGYETTASQFAGIVVELLREPARWDRLVRDPAMVPAAVEELLRINRLSETGLGRVALVDVELDGVTIGAGEVVLTAIGPANRDPRAFPDPDRYQPDRHHDTGRTNGRAEQHLTFGHGPHFCLGAHLARIEMVEALRALLAILPGLRLAVPATDITWRRSLIRGPEQVPLTW
jgi:cytochrome P450